MKKLIYLTLTVASLTTTAIAAEPVRISVDGNFVTYAVSNKITFEGQSHYEILFHASIDSPGDIYAVTLHRNCFGDLCSTGIPKTNSMPADWKQWDDRFKKLNVSLSLNQPLWLAIPYRLEDSALYEYLGSSRAKGESFEGLYTLKDAKGMQTTYSWNEFHVEPPKNQKFHLVKYAGKLLPVGSQETDGKTYRTIKIVRQ